jgi:hypothetical protein
VFQKHKQFAPHGTEPFSKLSRRLVFQKHKLLQASGYSSAIADQKLNQLPS